MEKIILWDSPFIFSKVKKTHILRLLTKLDNKEATRWIKEVRNGNLFAKPSGREVFQGFLNEKVLVLFLRKSGGVAIDTPSSGGQLGQMAKTRQRLD